MMNVTYTVERLGNMREVDLKTVPFETIDRCPLCGSDRLTDVALLRDSLISSWCSRCAHLFHRRRPTPEWYQRWYQVFWDRPTERPRRSWRSFIPPSLKRLIRQGMGYYTVKRGVGFSKPGDRWREIFDFCQPAVTQGSAVLEIGCGYGRNLLPFRHYGCLAYGIDPSPHRAESTGYFGIRAVALPVEQLQPETFGTFFDLVISNHSLEHLPSPTIFLEVVKRILKPGGWVCITVPNFENDFLIAQFFYALHIHCFSRHSLTEFLRTHRFWVHRLSEDFQIRVLAQYLPDVPPPLALPIAANGSRLPEELVLTNCFGPQYATVPGRKIYCHWSPFDVSELSKKCKYHYRVSFGTEASSAQGGGLIQLQVEGPVGVPIHFAKETAQTQASFWVK